VLPAKARLSRRDDFALAVRRGRRVSAPGIVVHAAIADRAQGETGAVPTHPLVGFIVGRSVGNAVTRNRLRRRLRHVMASRLDQLPPGARLVVRATPSAAQRSFDGLSSSVDRALARSFVPGRRT
jgi:ribonuclease P protein component